MLNPGLSLSPLSERRIHVFQILLFVFEIAEMGEYNKRKDNVTMHENSND